MQKGENGYAAIMTMILVSMILLSLLSQGAALGWSARFAATSHEKKRQADVLSRGCIDAAIAAIIKDSERETFQFDWELGVCEVKVVDSSDVHAVTFTIQARVGTEETGVAYTSMKIVADFGDIHLGEAIATSPQNPTLEVNILSREEISSLEGVL